MQRQRAPGTGSSDGDLRREKQLGTCAALTRAAALQRGNRRGPWGEGREGATLLITQSPADHPEVSRSRPGCSEKPLARVQPER